MSAGTKKQITSGLKHTAGKLFSTIISSAKNKCKNKYLRNIPNTYSMQIELRPTVTN